MSCTGGALLLRLKSSQPAASRTMAMTAASAARLPFMNPPMANASIYHPPAPGGYGETG
jgi:hypothetical protein